SSDDDGRADIGERNALEDSTIRRSKNASRRGGENSPSQSAENSASHNDPEDILELKNGSKKVLSKSSEGFEVTYDIEVNNGELNITPRGEDDSSTGARRAWDSAPNQHDHHRTGDQQDDHRAKRTTKLSRNERTTASEEDLKKEIEAVMDERKRNEARRKQLFEQARLLHDTIVEIKEKRREQWWVQYTAARRYGTGLEEQQAALRAELDHLHRRIIGSIVKRSPLVTGVRDEPSRKANLKISVIRLRHEIEDLKKRHESMDIKLETETKLKGQAEKEVKQLRQEVSKKKIDVALCRSRNPTLNRSLGDIPMNI
ncbi:uncharacterized protein LOC108674215, partial [Hyalella azteca]|uniref:Uncharacterized protein LOC108674215 n=1 Tax=Hyalella azteca TaxID=294128 RepID=A0A8B7NV91_HYAAZ